MYCGPGVLVFSFSQRFISEISSWLRFFFFSLHPVQIGPNPKQLQRIPKQRDSLPNGNLQDELSGHGIPKTSSGIRIPSLRSSTSGLKHSWLPEADNFLGLESKTPPHLYIIHHLFIHEKGEERTGSGNGHESGFFLLFFFFSLF